MNGRLKVTVSRRPKTEGVMTCRSLTVRERIMRFLLGRKDRVTVLIPGDCVGEIAICDNEKGEITHGQGKNDDQSM